MHRREWLSAVGSAATIGLAGCTGSDDETEPSDENGTESTDEEGTEQGPSLDEFDFPEHAFREGVEATHLATKHFERIRDEGSVTVSQSSEVTVDGSSFETTTTTRISSDGILVTEEDNETTEVRWTKYGSGRELIKREVGFRSEYQISNNTPREEEALSEWELSSFIEGVTFSEAITAVEIDGVLTARYDVTGLDESESNGEPQADEIEDVTGSIFVTEDGIIKRVEHETTRNIDGRSHERAVETTYSDIGSTTVSEPDWTETAHKEGRAFEASVTDGYLELELTNGNPIPDGTRVRLRTSERDGETILPESLSVGDSLFAAVGENGISTEVNDTPDTDSDFTGTDLRTSFQNEGITLYENHFDWYSR